MKKAIYKVPNGKLLKVFLDEADGKIKDIKITGDFFTHPEENIEKLEKFLKDADLTAETLGRKIRDFFAQNPTELFGVDEASIASTILQAHSQPPPNA